MSHAFARAEDERISWMRNLPFLAMHLVPLAAFFTEVTPFDWALCGGLYALRMFFITGAYHRYFSHRSYKTSRAMQFLLALGGTTAVQKGPLWWAGHHRHHHKHSDQLEDIHSPMKGLFWSHMGWIMCKKHDPTPEHLIKDFAKFPELRWLDKYHIVPPTILAAPSCDLPRPVSATVTRTAGDPSSRVTVPVTMVTCPVLPCRLSTALAVRFSRMRRKASVSATMRGTLPGRT